MGKITFMGAGSTVFAKNVLGDAMLTPALQDFEIALYDIDGERLEESYIMITLLNKNINEGRAKISKYLGVENRKEALRGADFVVDAIDTVKTKLLIAKHCADNGIPLISSMGTGNKLDMSKLKISDISKTTVCPLAKAVRVELRKMGITKLPVVYSEELPVRTGERVPSSISYGPAAAGLLLAQYVIGNIIKNEK